MKIGLYKTNFPRYQINRIEIYKRILKLNNVDFIELNINEHDFWDKIKNVDIFLFRWAHTDDDHQLVSTILPVIENYLKIKCFPDLNTSWHFDDKIKEYYLLKNMGYPVIDSWIFWEEENAKKWAEYVGYPIVFKLRKGAGSSNVVLLENKNETLKIISKMFGKGIKQYGIPHKGNVKYKKIEQMLRMTLDNVYLNKKRGIKAEEWHTEKNYVLFQKFLPDNPFDIRVTTIGKRVFAFRRFVRANDFRASGSGKIDYDITQIDQKILKLAFQISKELKFQSMAYDFLFNENGEPEICEISYTFQDYAIYKCPGFWDENLNWHEGHFWPQYLHLKDLLNLDNLLQPEINDIIS